MQNQDLITVVMSAYNAESTIEKAINSVLSQTYPHWELVIVNDASTDNTRQIAERFANEDKRVRLVNKDVNGGAGLARRTGIEARGQESEYLCFLDSDDSLNEDCLETLHTAAIRSNADIVSAGMKMIEADGSVREECPSKEVFVEGDTFYIDESNPNAIYPRFMNLCLMRSSLWDDVTYSSRRFLEDTPTFVKILYYASSRLMLPYAGYNYVQTDGSLCHQTDMKKRLIYTVLSSIESCLFFKGRETRLYGNFIKSLFLNFRQLKDLGLNEDDRKKYRDELSEIALYFIENIVTM